MMLQTLSFAQYKIWRDYWLLRHKIINMTMNVAGNVANINKLTVPKISVYWQTSQPTDSFYSQADQEYRLLHRLDWSLNVRHTYYFLSCKYLWLEPHTTTISYASWAVLDLRGMPGTAHLAGERETLSNAARWYCTTLTHLWALVQYIIRLNHLQQLYTQTIHRTDGSTTQPTDFMQ